jgi:hydroxypyruvate isomerase
MERREAIKSAAKILAGAQMLAIGAVSSCKAASPDVSSKIRQSVSRWCFSQLSIAELSEICKEAGISSIELLQPEEYREVKKLGLECALANGSKMGIERGFNRVEHHDTLLQDYEHLMKEAAEAGVRQIVCFSGNRAGISDAEGLENCLPGLEKLMTLADDFEVNVIMELLNSKIDHADYQCDHTEWGVTLAKKLGHPRFKLLYDIYHMQIMEGDIIRTIRDNIAYIGHFHTAGVPGRNEIDETQELYYPAIVKAIADSGYEGYIGHEFIPLRENYKASLRQAVEHCAV